MTSGLLEPFERRRHEAGMQLLGQPLEERAEADRAQVAHRVARVDVDARQPAPDVGEPGRAQPRLGVLGRRELPVGRPALQVLGVRRLLGHVQPGLLDRRDVAGAAALGDEPAARLEGRVQPREQARVVEDPVERRRREDRVDGLLQLELEQVRLADVDRRRQLVARALDHRPRAVDRDHAPAREALEQQPRHAARPAARVEHRLVAVEEEPVEHVGPHRGHRRRQALVGRGVPVARLCHTNVRYHVHDLSTDMR